MYEYRKITDVTWRALSAALSSFWWGFGKDTKVGALGMANILLFLPEVKWLAPSTLVNTAYNQRSY